MIFHCFWLPGITEIGFLQKETNFLFLTQSGNAAYCWISDKKVLAVAVVTPVCLSLVFNSFCLLKSTYAIRHLQQVCSITLTGDFPTGDSLAPKWVLIRN